MVVGQNYFRHRRVHLMGIGGAGMSVLAPLLQRAGAQVSGCDLAANEQTQRLIDGGIPVYLGHSDQHVADHDVLVHTSAVANTHVEVRAAQALGLEVLSRQACLAELLQGQRTVAIAGSHGKTSTTWMAGHLMVASGLDPVVLVGGTVAPMAGGARMGSGEWAVVEVDESDGGFAHTTPSIAIVTNLEPEHLDHYGSFHALCRAFAKWLAKMGDQGVVIAPHSGLPSAILSDVKSPVRWVGIDAGDVHAQHIRPTAQGTSCHVVIDGESRGEMTVPIPGEHMLHNALMAVAAIDAVGIRELPLDKLVESGRVGRRFTEHGVYGGVRVIEDYAHHPTEIRATLQAAALGGGRLQVIFQPHRYSRTRDLMAEFSRCFDRAHALAIVATYAASEDPLPGADGAGLAAAVASARAQAGVDPHLSQYAGQWRAAVAFVAAHAQSGDAILILGAGDIGLCVPDVIRAIT